MRMCLGEQSCVIVRVIVQNNERIRRALLDTLLLLSGNPRKILDRRRPKLKC